jgi:hypothetical protein
VARLIHLPSGEEHFLSPRHLIGRAPACQLRVDDPSVSGYHAELAWDGARWSVQDLGSRNGTALAGRRLAKGERVALAEGDELVLADRLRFRLVDASAPHLVATSAAGDVRVAVDDLLCLPSDDAPELTIYRDRGDRWLVESEDATTPLDEALPVIAGGVAWRVLSPKLVVATRDLDAEPQLGEHTFAFHVSRDGEHIELTLERRGRPTTLEPRAHLSLLLVLARERLRDAASATLPPSERGWVYRDDLPRLLGVQAELVHLWIHRARKQLARAGLRDAAAIIERRAGNTQLRIGAHQLVVIDR